MALLKEIIISSLKIFAVVPGAITGLATLRKIGEETSFDKSNPTQYAKLSQYINSLLYILIQHWIAIAFLSIFGGTIWAVFVVEPKTASLKAFNEARQKRIGE